MNSLLRLITATVAITAVLSKQIDTGPRTEADNRAVETKTSPKRYVAEEVVVYLSPSQLQAIQEGKGFIDSEPLATTEAPAESQGSEESEQLEEDVSSQSQSDESEAQVSQEDDEKEESSLPAEEQKSENIEDELQLSQKNLLTLDDLYTLLSNYPELANQPAEPTESEAESGESAEEKKVESEGNGSDTSLRQRFRLIPYESATEATKPTTTTTAASTTTTEPTLRDPIRERWLRILEQNRIQLRNALLEQDRDTATATTTSTTTTTTEKPQVKSESTLAKLRYSSKYRFKSQTDQNKELRNKTNLKKQKVSTKGIARANDVVRKEAKKANQQQKSLIKEVKIRTPVFIPVPQSAKIPLNSAIPLKGLKPVSIQANKAETKATEQKKQESQVRAQDTESKALLPNNLTVGANNTYVVENRTSTDSEQNAPVEINLRQKGKPERITIIRHVFEN